MGNIRIVSLINKKINKNTFFARSLCLDPDIFFSMDKLRISSLKKIKEIQVSLAVEERINNGYQNQVANQVGIILSCSLEFCLSI